MAQGQIPASAMFEGVMLLFSGALLLTPGFVTDSIGFALLVPAIRSAIINAVIATGAYQFHGKAHYRRYDREDSTIIDGEIVEDDQQQLK
jgi:UPF0716 protein FxsA